MGARKKVSAVAKRQALNDAATAVRTALEKIESVQGEERDLHDDLALAVKALRMIESSPQGTPARNLIGVASGTLSRIGLRRVKRGL